MLKIKVQTNKRSKNNMSIFFFSPFIYNVQLKTTDENMEIWAKIVCVCVYT